MKLKVILESKNFNNDKEMTSLLENNPCEFCFLGQGFACASKKFCRWESYKEIYIKNFVKELKQ